MNIFTGKVVYFDDAPHAIPGQQLRITLNNAVSNRNLIQSQIGKCDFILVLLVVKCGGYFIYYGIRATLTDATFYQVCFRTLM